MFRVCISSNEYNLDYCFIVGIQFIAKNHLRQFEKDGRVLLGPGHFIIF